MGRNTKAVNIDYFLKLIDILIKSRTYFYDEEQENSYSMLELLVNIKYNKRVEDFITSSIHYHNFPYLDYWRLPKTKWTLYQRLMYVCDEKDRNTLLKLDTEIIMLLRDDELLRRTYRLVNQNTDAIQCETITKFYEYLKKRNETNETND